MTVNAHIWSPNSAASRALERGRSTASAKGAAAAAAIVTGGGTRRRRRTRGTITDPASASQAAARTDVRGLGPVRRQRFGLSRGLRARNGMAALHPFRRLLAARRGEYRLGME